VADLGHGGSGAELKRSLVTGGHGFVASNLARALLERGDAVTVLDLAPPPSSGLALQGIAAEVELIEADLRDAELVGATIAAGEFDVVFHLAAQTLVGPAMADPAPTFEVNVRGTWNLLEACRRAEVPAVVVASSDKAYGPSEELPYREEMRLRPASPYEASKAAADAIALSYRPAYGLPVAVTRFANIFGGGDPNFSRLIPEAIAAVLDGRRPQIRSDGSPERDFLYVADAVSAYLAVESVVGAGGPGAGEAFNAGGERPYSVAEVLETIVAVSSTDLEPDFLGTGNPSGEIDRQYVDSTKLREMTGWRPEVALRDGLIRTLDWYRDHPELRPVAGSVG
jgi:CDP-glucose 4,6-dehydratase